MFFSASGTFKAALVAALSLHGATSARALDCSGVEPASGSTLRAQLVTSALSSPVDATAPPGDTARLFIVEQVGRIRILDLADDTLVTRPFLDIASKVDSGGEKGLLGLAFHPQYAQNGFFHVNYTRTVDSRLETVVERYSVSGTDPDAADPASGKLILRFSQPFSNHNGGQLAFGPTDGYLYISTGDGGSGGDPQNNAQNPLSYLGKILRIDVSSGDPYGIPPGNPFAGGTGALPEIWALGLRNPWRCAFDPETGDFFIADVGQSAWEEVNRQPASSSGGENYGWKVREGTHPFSNTPFGPGTVVDPIHEYPHSGTGLTGCSITGGVVYRGCLMPDLHGTYFFADYCGDWVASFKVEGGTVSGLADRTAELNADLGSAQISSIAAFGLDGRGEVYICALPSRLYRVLPAAIDPPGETFFRGDSNGDSVLDISDPVHTLLQLFTNLLPPAPCSDALDSDDDGELSVTDAIFSLRFLFADGPAPPAPFEACGPDGTADALACVSSTCAAAN